MFYIFQRLRGQVGPCLCARERDLHPFLHWTVLARRIPELRAIQRQCHVSAALVYVWSWQIVKRRMYTQDCIRLQRGHLLVLLSWAARI